MNSKKIIIEKQKIVKKETAKVNNRAEKNPKNLADSKKADIVSKKADIVSNIVKSKPLVPAIKIMKVQQEPKQPAKQPIKTRSPTKEPAKDVIIAAPDIDKIVPPIKIASIIREELVKEPAVIKPAVSEEKKLIQPLPEEVVKKNTKHEKKSGSKEAREAIKEAVNIQNIQNQNIPNTHKTEKNTEQQSEISNKLSEENQEVNFQEDKNKAEALLFACGRYIEEQTISELCNIDKKKLHKILTDLKKDYESKNNSLMIFNEGTSWKINVREKYLSIVRKIVADTELPKSVMETLAIIAWKTPINQSEVVKIRGNKCYDHIEVLEEAGFISKDKKGRSYILKATEKFFTYFEIDQGNLKGVFDTVKIPEIKEQQKTLEQSEIIPENEVDKINAIELKKWTETDEEKEGHKQFLEQIENKIKEAKEKNELLAQEIPRPGYVQSEEEAKQSLSSEKPEEKASDVTAPVELAEKNIEKAIEEAQNHDAVSQTQNAHKPKSLTKKQLEKKFKDDLLRVRDKMENKKK